MSDSNQVEVAAEQCREFSRLAESAGTSQALSWLAEHFAAANDAHRLFEVRKMQSRLRAGQPAFTRRNPNEAAAPRNESLERDLIEACREAGERLIAARRYQHAWVFLNPVDDAPWVRRLLEENAPADEQLAEWIDVALYQGAHPVAGYRRLLQNYGTCNAISTWDAMAPHLQPSDRTGMAEQLVRHAYDEICQNIERVMGEQPAEAIDERIRSLRADWQSRPTVREAGIENATAPPGWLTQALDNAANLVSGSVPHCDATHLSAVVRIGRMTRREESWKRLLELCRYGQLFPPALQYPDEAPFAATYRDHRYYFEALLGEHRDRAIEHFVSALSSLETGPVRAVALEVVVDLLDRIGWPDRAIQLALADNQPALGDAGISPSLLELGLASNDPAPLLEYFRSQGDLLSFAILQLATARA